MFKDQSIQAFLDQLASSSATPSGGSAAALIGAMGAALVSMVANLTVGKPKYQAVEAQMRTLLARAEALRARLTTAAEDDIAAFNQVMAAYRLPHDTEEEKAQRHLAIQTALKVATQTPLNCARLCAEVIELCRWAAEQGNCNLITDAGVGLLAAQAALRSCAINLTANLNAIQDQEFARTCQEELARILNAKSAEAEATLAWITAKLSQ